MDQMVLNLDTPDGCPTPERVVQDWRQENPLPGG
jgi:hypothetical protein